MLSADDKRFVEILEAGPENNTVTRLCEIIRKQESENQNLSNYIEKIELGVITWCNRPTKDGAKKLRELVGLCD